jgi:hypothetical protein
VRWTAVRSWTGRWSSCGPGTRWWCGGWTGWGRSLRHLIDTVTGLDAQGVGFRSLRESIDTTTSGGRLVFHLFGALAQFEREVIRDRTVAGLASARARGRVGGRPPKLTGDQMRTARRLYEERELTVAEIGGVLGVSRTSIYRALAAGVEQGVDRAYKCRVRSPWWQVPLSAPADLLLTYMNADTPG